ncbi:DMT family transporter [Rhodoferax saidenbachensis]|uniref:Drug/metabolite transporter (DMT)-like permease n=1 Tax=Rhodoferax saidenbachensis TaxID=1484693 RepID=A0ABU1ZNX2_9BURK|nr:DMT family transporter [Rhodoferax saidenbachensis]MDR7307193.1 drug/metabolite transporter (DMT)-like permease [Rhodoferax saidenbachensis]
MRAFLWMTGALVSFCLMAIGGRELAGGINTFQILLSRSVIGLLVVSAVIWRTGKPELFRTQRLKLQVGRNLFHFVGQYGWFLGIGLLPLAQVFALEFTTPLWTLLIAALFLKEKLTTRKAVAIALGSIGVVLILNPGGDIVNPAALYVLGAAVCYALSYVATKALSTTEAPLTILFYMCLVQLPLGLLLSASHFVVPTPLQWVWLTLIGLSALSAHFCLTHAMKTAEVSVVVTLDFLRLPLIGVVGMALYGEGFKPMLLVGAALMLGGNLVNVYKPR